MATYGFQPYRETALQDALRLGGFSGQASLRRVAADRLAYSEPSGTPSGETTDTSSKPGGKSILGKIGSFLASDQFRAGVAGLASPIQANDPLGNFARAATVGLGTRAGIREKRAEGERKAAGEARDVAREGRDVRRLGLEERRVAADELRASREPRTPQGRTTISYEEWLAMTPEERAQYEEFRNVGDADARDPVANAKRLAEMKRDNPELFPEADPRMGTETTILERDPLGYPVRTSSRYVRKSDVPKPAPGFEPEGAPAYDVESGLPISKQEAEDVSDIMEMTDPALLQRIANDRGKSASVRNAARRRLAGVSGGGNR